MARLPTLPGEGEVYPRYVFFEPLLAGRRVLELDAVAATGGRSARFLKEKGAAKVVSLEANPAEVRRAKKDPELALDGVAISDVGLDSLSGQTFDLVFAHAVDADAVTAARLGLLRRVLARTGWLVLCARDPRGTSLARLHAPAVSDEGRLEQLAARLKGAFLSVELATQTAVFAYAVAPQGVDDAQTSLDESLVDAAAPAYRLFICGAQPTGLATAVLAPLPAAVIGQAPAALAAADPLGLASELAQDIEETRIEELERRTQTALEEAQRAELVAAHALAERDRAKAELARRAPQTDPDLAERLRAAEAARDEKDAELQVMSSALESAQQVAAAAEAEQRRLQELVLDAQARLAATEARLREVLDAGQLQEWRLGDELRETQARLAAALVRWREDLEAVEARAAAAPAPKRSEPANGVHGTVVPVSS